MAKLKEKKIKNDYEEFLNEADLILMEYPELMRRLKQIGYYVFLKEITPIKSKMDKVKKK